MRISDWSSDVCSSDLCERILPVQAHIRHVRDVTDDRQSCSLAIEFKPKSGWPPLDSATSRSEERRVGKECVSTCRSRWSPCHYKKKTVKNNIEGDTLIIITKIYSYNIRKSA